MKIRFTILFVFCALQCLTQDLSLSQFHNLPALLNPAAVGNFPEQFRVTAGHKSQWGALTNGFSTNFFSVEGSLAERKKDSYPSVGLIAITDKAGDSGYSSTILRALGAYNFKLSRYNSLSFGLEAGFNQRSFSLDGLAWDSQFNGAGHDPSLPSNESFSNQNVNNIDFGFGSEFKHVNIRELSWTAGLGIHHYYQDRTVLDNGEDLHPILAQAYWIAEQKNGFLKWRYYALLQSQNLAAALSGAVGGELFYRFSYDARYTNFKTSSSISLGALYRYHDAVTVLTSFEFKRILRATFSYDFTVNGLATSNGFRGGPEFMITYLGDFSGIKKRKI